MRPFFGVCFWWEGIKKFLFPQSFAMLGAVERIGEGRNNLGERNLLQTTHKKKRIPNENFGQGNPRKSRVFFKFHGAFLFFKNG